MRTSRQPRVTVRLRRLLTAIVGGLTVAHLVHRRYRDWGTTATEAIATLPGDELVEDPAIASTRAVTIAASAAEVWCWLSQIGYDRGGFYSYDWLENLIGLEIHSATRIDPALQNLRVGDRIRLLPPGWMGLAQGMALPIVQLVPGERIVLREDPAEGPWDGIWSFQIIPRDAESCRLISRSRAHSGGTVSRIADVIMDPVTLLMTRRMLLGIKDRAEHATGPPSAR